MAENDIYDNQNKYKRFKVNLGRLTQKPNPHSKRKYFCKNPINLQYFENLFLILEAKDISYIRRMRVLQTLKLIAFATNEDLSCLNRMGVNKIVSFMHTVYTSSKSKSDFIKDMKYIWKCLFPDKDEKGREDETIVPYVVRHLSPSIDKSKEKLRNDRLTFDEYQKIVDYFSKDIRIQSYITLAYESLGRPQEILYIKIRDIEFQDNYAKLYISEHGKEGCGFLLCIDSYPFLIKWLEIHPFKNNPDAFLFITNTKPSSSRQLTPYTINMHLRKACGSLAIKKRITCYSLKRNGVTFRKARGESDVEIQHVARWKSTKQLATYDYTNQEDMLKKQLMRKGLIKQNINQERLSPETRKCGFCNANNGFNDIFCKSCKRPLDRAKIIESASHFDKFKKLQRDLLEMKTELESRAKYDDILIQLLSDPTVKSKYKEFRNVAQRH
jgi:integrase